MWCHVCICFFFLFLFTLSTGICKKSVMLFWTMTPSPKLQYPPYLFAMHCSSLIFPERCVSKLFFDKAQVWRGMKLSMSACRQIDLCKIDAYWCPPLSKPCSCFVFFLSCFLFPRHCTCYKLLASVVAKKRELILWNDRLRTNGVFPRETGHYKTNTPCGRLCDQGKL